MYPTGKSGKPQPFTQPIHTDPGKRSERKQVGYWETRYGVVEYLLCDNCEQYIGRLEDYAKRFFYGDSKPIRLQLPLSRDPQFTADYKKLKLFQLSILWRAAEANGEFFSAVDLHEHHRERLREMLFSKEPGHQDEYCCTLLRLVVASPEVAQAQQRAGISIETGVFAPIRNDQGTWNSYTFVMGGILWSFCVTSSGLPELIRNSYIKENGQFWLMPMKADEFLINFGRRAVAAGNITQADVEESIAARFESHNRDKHG